MNLEDLDELCIYTPLNKKSLKDFFHKYFEKSVQFSFNKGAYYVFLKNPSRENFVWSGTIDQGKSGPFDSSYKFRSNSFFYSDTLFQDSDNEEISNYEDLWFQNFRNVVSYFQDAEIPHYVVATFNAFDERKIGGLDSEGNMSTGDIDCLGLFDALFTKK